MFRISALRRDDFEEFFQLGDDELAARGAKRYIANRKPGFPCRVSLEDADPGERVVLVPYSHQPARSPYRSSGPIFVRESARTVSVPPDTVPALLRSRMLSVRAYDTCDLMIDAVVVDGRELEPALAKTLANPRVSYVHLHYAGPGCYACRVDRV